MKRNQTWCYNKQKRNRYQRSWRNIFSKYKIKFTSTVIAWKYMFMLYKYKQMSSINRYNFIIFWKINISTYFSCYVISNTAGSFWLEFSQFLHIRYFILFTRHSPKAFLLIFNTFFVDYVCVWKISKYN